MMRIAIAGACGFAYILASEIVQTANVVMVLSRQECPEFEQNLGVLMAVVNYASVEELRYSLQGIDLVISTIAGDEQLNLINAARRAHVRTFVPSEFEGGIGHLPTPDPLDCGSEAAMELLLRHSQSGSNRMGYTIFSCGIFYERFGPGGLGLYNICAGSNVQIPGNFLVDVEASTAEIIVHDAQGRPIEVSMTSVYDVARFIAAAINIGPTEWPTEFKMRGDQMSVRDIVAACSKVRGVPINPVVHQYKDLQAPIDYNLDQEGLDRWYYLQRLLTIANGRYSFRQANLNETVDRTENVGVTPERFRDWLQRVWPQPPALCLE
ncbi:NAD(P)-binding protein [Hyaloscypha hepaticicola]|uniref:NAD(P)-binding protein n=1 Tax=Hyaloscypha hepaticicola TaxID=2082293 RepID=A0A2J6Q5T0_9HELO|nr:NAD(P)-binding protein [Hyaloscypha hepaticicola]